MLKNNSDVQVDIYDVEWVQYIFVMGNSHTRTLQDRFKNVLDRQKVICLGIPGNYQYMDEALVAILERKVPVLVK